MGAPVLLPRPPSDRNPTLNKPAFRKQVSKTTRYWYIMGLGLLFPILVMLCAIIPPKTIDMALKGMYNFIGMKYNNNSKDNFNLSKQDFYQQGDEIDPDLKASSFPSIPSQPYETFWQPESDSQFLEYVNLKHRSVKEGVMAMFFMEECMYCSGLALQLKDYFEVIANKNKQRSGSTNLGKSSGITKDSSVAEKIEHSKLIEVTFAALDSQKIGRDFLEKYNVQRYPTLLFFYHETFAKKDEATGEIKMVTELKTIEYASSPLVRLAPVRIFDFLHTIDYLSISRSKNLKRSVMMLESSTNSTQNETSEVSETVSEPASESFLPTDRDAMSIVESDQDVYSKLESAKLNYPGNGRILFLASPNMYEILRKIEDLGEDTINFDYVGRHDLNSKFNYGLPPLRTIVAIDKRLEGKEMEEKCKASSKSSEEKAAATVTAEATAVTNDDVKEVSTELDSGASKDEAASSESESEKSTKTSENKEESDADSEAESRSYKYDPCLKLQLARITVSVESEVNPHTSVQKFSFKTEDDVIDYLTNGQKLTVASSKDSKLMMSNTRLPRLSLPSFSQLYFEALDMHIRFTPVLIVANQDIKRSESDPRNAKILDALEKVHRSLDFMIHTLWVDTSESPKKSKQYFGFRHFKPTKNNPKRGMRQEFVLYLHQNYLHNERQKAAAKNGGKKVNPKNLELPYIQFNGDPTNVDEWTHFILTNLQVMQQNNANRLSSKRSSDSIDSDSNDDLDDLDQLDYDDGTINGLENSDAVFQSLVGLVEKVSSKEEFEGMLQKSIGDDALNRLTKGTSVEKLYDLFKNLETQGALGNNKSTDDNNIDKSSNSEAESSSEADSNTASDSESDSGSESSKAKSEIDEKKVTTEKENIEVSSGSESKEAVGETATTSTESDVKPAEA